VYALDDGTKKEQNKPRTALGATSCTGLRESLSL
jgi:hypothetical protein